MRVCLGLGMGFGALVFRVPGSGLQVSKGFRFGGLSEGFGRDRASNFVGPDSHIKAGLIKHISAMKFTRQNYLYQ